MTESGSTASQMACIEPYGTWKSPISAELIARGTVGLGQISMDGDNIYWTELRPSEGGRTALVRRSVNGEITDMLPKVMSVRSRVHEYGGGGFVVDDGDVWFCNDADQRLYSMPRFGKLTALTPEGSFRYADMVVDRRKSRLIAVCEEHNADNVEPVNRLISIGFDKAITKLVSGADFYASPRLSPDGRNLAWLSWSHPNMPWDETELWVAKLAENGELFDRQRVAGGDAVSIFQPAWSPEGVLYFVSDQTGWWNIYKLDSENGKIRALYPTKAEFGRPQWAFGMTTYGFARDGDIVCTYFAKSEWRLARIAIEDAQLRDIETNFCAFDNLKVLGNKAAFVAGHATEASALTVFDLDSGEPQILRRSMNLEVQPENISIGKALEISVGYNAKVHAFYYAPLNRDYMATPEELAPLIVKSHGGPTSQTTGAFSLGIQFWTNRGFAVLDVNYRGSTGYGRAYRKRLEGQWGVIDVEDCIVSVNFLAEQRLIDCSRVAITGGSAGGFTTLSALTFHNTFRAGASYYGIGDLEALARDTHKFEAHYLDRLIGVWPEAKDLYKARSPFHHTNHLECPVIFFQGAEDKIVPPNQAQVMVDELQSKNLPVAYVEFEGEGHGFRKAENIERALAAELYFYGRVLGFKPADALKPIDIGNM